MALYLRENLTFETAKIQLVEGKDGKELYMEGICIQGGVKNANERVYPVSEITNAVKTLNEQIKEGNSVLGEVDHPDDLKINLDRVCHMITNMWMDGPNGYGKLKILPTPMGELVKTMLQSGVRLGVSSRGSGNVDPHNGHVSDFEIVTVDVVAQPSAPNAYPKAIYEGLMNMKYGHQILEMARESGKDDKIQKYLKDEVSRLIKDLKIQENRMLDAIKPLLDSDLVNEDTRQAIAEQWEAKLSEAKETVRAELREEFAQRYEHDKTVMVEALDKMVTEGLTSELSALNEEKKALAEDRVKFAKSMTENANKFNNFMVTKLSEELRELRKDRKVQVEGFEKLESFVVGALAEEIKEFAADKKDLVESKVRLVRDARGQLEALKSKFIKESAKKMSATVSTHLKAELSQLQEDIKIARENNFGRRIFEAYATEFGATHLNENAEVRKLSELIAAKDKQLAEAIQAQTQAKKLVESKDHEIKVIREANERDATLDELLSPLNDEKRAVMTNLLENVQTSRLKNAFEKYLPAVLSEAKATKKADSLVEATGNKSAKAVEATSNTNNVVELKRLAGL